jgi:hypothetical protein
MFFNRGHFNEYILQPVVVELDGEEKVKWFHLIAPQLSHIQIGLETKTSFRRFSRLRRPIDLLFTVNFESAALFAILNYHYHFSKEFAQSFFWTPEWLPFEQ